MLPYVCDFTLCKPCDVQCSHTRSLKYSKTAPPYIFRFVIRAIHLLCESKLFLTGGVPRKVRDSVQSIFCDSTTKPSHSSPFRSSPSSYLSRLPQTCTQKPSNAYLSCLEVSFPGNEKTRSSQ